MAEGKPRNLNVESIHKIIAGLQNQVKEYSDMLQYITGIESRIDFICRQNAAYKERCQVLAQALEDMVIEYCTHGDRVYHNRVKANQQALDALGIKNGTSIENLEKLLERKLK